MRFFIFSFFILTLLVVPSNTFANEGNEPNILAHNEWDDGDQLWHIKFVRCLNPECTQTEKKLIDKSKFGRAGVRIIKDKYGLPFLVYKWADPEGSLFDQYVKIASCNDFNCDSVDKMTFPNYINYPTGGVSFSPGDPSVTLDRSGNPKIINDDWGIQIANCHDPKCQSFNIKKIADINLAGTYYGVEVYPKIQLGRGGRVIFSYRNPETETVFYGYCQDLNCNNPVLKEIPIMGHYRRVGWSHDIAPGPNGLPIIVLTSQGYGVGSTLIPREVFAVFCLDYKCENTEIVLLETLTNPADQIRVQVAQDGNAIIGYLIQEPPYSNRLRLVKCLDSLCQNRTSNSIINASTEYPHHTLGHDLSLSILGNKLLIGAAGTSVSSTTGYDRWSLTVSCTDLLCEGQQSHKVHSNTSINTPIESRNMRIHLPN